MIKVHGDVNVKEIKRLYVDLDVAFSCPECKTKAPYNTDRYFSYLRIGELYNVAFYCEKCDRHFLVPALIKSCRMEFDFYSEKAKMD